MIGYLEKTVIDCPDPRALAEFYCQVLGTTVSEDIDGWVVIGAQAGLRQLAFQRASEWIDGLTRPTPSSCTSTSASAMPTRRNGN